MKLHHIGIVVQEPGLASIELNRFIDFTSKKDLMSVASQKTDILLLQARNVYIELVAPNSSTSPVYNYSQKGGGFHHLCYEVDDVETTFAEMVEKGAKPIVRPVLGFEDRLTAFLYLPLKSMNCNLIEIAQKK